MSDHTVTSAVLEARRFLLRYDEWKAKQGQTYEYNGQTYVMGTPRENAALRRASMDLTRALADMRRPA